MRKLNTFVVLLLGCLTVAKCLNMMKDTSGENEQLFETSDYGGVTSASCYKIDISMCFGKTCLLGYERDEEGCVISCNCANKGLFEGDILVKGGDLNSLNTLYGIAGAIDNRGASTETSYRKRWNNIPDDGKYIVPFVVDRSLYSKPKYQAMISKAILQYHKKTCIRLRPRKREADYVRFKYGRGCSSPVGRQGGENMVTLGDHCLNVGTVIHEIMHSLGFFHEQSRPDRDNYVAIISANVRPVNIKKNFEDAMLNFKKMSPRDINSLGSPYDYDSVMHYGGFFFSKNRQPTIVNKKTNVPIKYQRVGFSDEDVIQINKMYKC